MPRTRLIWLLPLALLLLLVGEPDRHPGAGRRVLVLGLDGATWELLQPWIDAGDLPCLARLQAEGAWGELQSVVPYLSPPAWTSAVTGVNPGRHAIFDFQRRLPGEPVVVNETARSRRAPAIWQLLERRRRTLLLNIPMTDPPDALDGLCIAGFPHLDRHGFTFPDGLADRYPDYPLDGLEIRLVPDREDSLLAALRAQREARAAIAREWLASERYDLAWIVFTSPDRLQHTFWRFQDPDHPLFDPRAPARFRDALRAFWIELDARLGELWALAGEGTDLLVLSDHGFGRRAYDVRLRALLRAAGFSEAELAELYLLDPNDASRLYIGRRGRDPGATLTAAEACRLRARLRAALLAARDPERGVAVCAEAWNNEEVFAGPYVEKGPDLVLLPAPGYFFVWESRAGGEGRVAPASWVTPHGPAISGWHRMNGIYALAGPASAAGRSDGTGERAYSLLDVVPTLLYLLGEPIPEGLDGALMRGAILPARLAADPPRTRPAPAAPPPPAADPDPGPDPRELESLPYLGG